MNKELHLYLSYYITLSKTSLSIIYTAPLTLTYLYSNSTVTPFEKFGSLSQMYPKSTSNLSISIE